MDTSEHGNRRHNDGVRYEGRDARFTPVFVSVAGLLLLLVVIVVATVGVFRLFAARRPRTVPVLEPSRESPVSELQQLRQKEHNLLQSYQWVSREQGIVRIPIERAMQLTVEEAEAHGDSR